METGRIHGRSAGKVVDLNVGGEWKFLWSIRSQEQERKEEGSEGGEIDARFNQLMLRVGKIEI